jgi:hypothetical protein
MGLAIWKVKIKRKRGKEKTETASTAAASSYDKCQRGNRMEELVCWSNCGGKAAYRAT